jgi:hypothetical protein
MKKLLLTASVVALGFWLSAPAFAATAAECQEIWTKADIDNDGSIDGDEIGPYAQAAKKAGLNIAADGKITQAEFMPACEKDVFQGLPQLHSAPKGPRTGG